MADTEGSSKEAGVTDVDDSDPTVEAGATVVDGSDTIVPFITVVEGAARISALVFSARISKATLLSAQFFALVISARISAAAVSARISAATRSSDAAIPRTGCVSRISSGSGNGREIFPKIPPLLLSTISSGSRVDRRGRVATLANNLLGLVLLLTTEVSLGSRPTEAELEMSGGESTDTISSSVLTA